MREYGVILNMNYWRTKKKMITIKCEQAIGVNAIVYDLTNAGDFEQYLAGVIEQILAEQYNVAATVKVVKQ